jgi:serine-type D-Ala-D-Ala carboxypeptidase (penicillin-binding protein 5/6)
MGLERWQGSGAGWFWMKPFAMAAALLILAAPIAFAGPAVALKKPLRAATAKAPSVAPPAIEPKAPYEAYVVVDAADGRVLEGLNVNLVWPQASLTKLMLACVVMDKVNRGEADLSDTVKITKAAESMGGSQVFLKAGEIFTLEELMSAALIESANDAAFAVAEHTAGSAEAFVELMNRKARALGLLDTEYFCVHGLPPVHGDSPNVTTCRDMAMLALEALRHPKILEWTSTEQATFRNGTLVMTNKNKLVGKMPEVDGLKTGFTRKSGFNIVATARNGDRRLIMVVLGSPEGRIRDGFAAEKLREYLTN